MNTNNARPKVLTAMLLRLQIFWYVNTVPHNKQYRDYRNKLHNSCITINQAQYTIHYKIRKYSKLRIM